MRVGRCILASSILCTPLPAANAQQPSQQPANWSQLPHMQLERQFAGPLQDTIIQRWRDPADGTVCYIYLPISAPHSAPTASSFVQYGANTIGSISCFPGSPSPVAGPPRPPSAAAAPRGQQAPTAPAGPSAPAR